MALEGLRQLIQDELYSSAEIYVRLAYLLAMHMRMLTCTRVFFVTVANSRACFVLVVGCRRRFSLMR